MILTVQLFNFALELEVTVTGISNMKFLLLKVPVKSTVSPEDIPDLTKPLSLK